MASESITLQSEDLQDAKIVSDTIVDARYNAGAGANYYYPAVDFNDSSGSTLAGLTLVKGTGGGVLCENVNSVKITNCMIQDNEWHGIRLNGSSADIQNCEIRANTSDETYDSNGVYCVSASDVNVNNCVIADNAGNGIYCNQSTTVITGCTIEENEDSGIYAQQTTLGIMTSIFSNNGEHGIYEYYPVGVSVIMNSIVRHNGDDGIHSEGFSSGPQIANNWIYSNSGSGIETYNPWPTWPPPVADAVIATNTIVNNGANGVKSDWAEDVEITNCIIWDNGADELYAGDSETFTVTYSCIEGGYTGTENIESDPCFVDANANDFHLAGGSPCIDTGDPDFEPEPNETDIDGGPRVMDGDANDIVIVDMGADEFWPADLSRDGLVNFIDYAMLTAYWQDVGIDYNDVFFDGDSNSVGLAEFCDKWLWCGGSPPGPMPLMAGPSGEGMMEGLGLQDAPIVPSELTAVEEKPVIVEPVDVQKLLDWLAEIWLDPEVQKEIDAEAWLKLYESLKELE